MRKRWIVAALVLLCAAVWAWPYVGAYSLAEAAQRGDAADVASRVDFPAVRHSLAHQVVRAYLKQSRKADKLGAFGRGMAMAVGTSVADPYLTELLTPDAITTLLGSGRLKPMTIENRTVTFDRKLPELSEAFGTSFLSVLVSSYYDGIVGFVFHVDGGDGDARYGIHMRLSGATWQLSGIDFPEPLIDRIAADIVAKEKASKQS